MAIFTPLEYVIEGAKLRVEYRDMTTLNVAVMVSSDDVNLSMSSGVSHSLRQVGGSSILNEAQTQAPIELGDIAITTAGQLQAQRIFHAAVLDYTKPDQTTPDLIRKVARKCLEQCDKRRFQSIAFPALATGNAGLSPERSATAILIETASYLSNFNQHIKTVTISLYPRENLQSDVLLRFYSQISNFLQMTEELQNVTMALSKLEKTYRELGSTDAAEQTSQSLDSLEQQSERLKTGILEQEPSNAKKEMAWNNRSEEIALNLDKILIQENRQESLAKIRLQLGETETLQKLEQEYKEYRIATLRALIVIQGRKTTDLELELALRGSSAPPKMIEQLQEERRHLQRLEAEMEQLKESSLKAVPNAVRVNTNFTKPTVRDKVFFSYSHKDMIWLQEFQKFLKPILRKQEIVIWDDTQIKPGAEWQNEIEAALTSAKVAVLLVSSDFLASEFIDKQELPPLLEAAKEEGLKIIWVHVSYCLYEETEISAYQAAHDPSRPLDTLPTAECKRVIGGICKAIKEAANPL